MEPPSKGDNHGIVDIVISDHDAVAQQTDCDLQEVALANEKTVAVSPTAPELTEQEEQDVNNRTATIPIQRRKSIELQKIEIDQPKSVEANGTDIPPKRPPRESITKPEVIYAPERLSNKMGCLKCALLVITFPLMIIGIAMIGIAAWLKADPDFWNIRTGMDLGQFSSSANIVIAVGILVVVIGFIGFCGASRENSCLLMTYCIIGLILVVLEAAAVGVVWSATNNPEMRNKLADALQKGIDGLEDKNMPMGNLLDIIQEKLECCGVKGPDDYAKEKPPNSCLDKNTRILYKKGCLDKLLNYLKSKASLIGGITVAILLLQFGGLSLALLFFCAIRQGDNKVF